ncbi:MAG: hypothetical protein GY755_13640 [Chloroflexi bacterium]|nr:hypothetical protein [Chloroflexota bacterium]
MKFRELTADLNDEQVAALSEDGKVMAYFFMKGKKIVNVEVEGYDDEYPDEFLALYLKAAKELKEDAEETYQAEIDDANDEYLRCKDIEEYYGVKGVK